MQTAFIIYHRLHAIFMVAVNTYANTLLCVCVCVCTCVCAERGRERERERKREGEGERESERGWCIRGLFA